MIVASLFGRLAAAPEEKVTKNGKPMVVARMAVDVAGMNAEQDTMWVSILAFGQAATTLLGLQKGQSIGAIGKLSRSHYKGRDDGLDKESWSLMVDSLMSAAWPAKKDPNGNQATPSMATSPAPTDYWRAKAKAKAKVETDMTPFDDDIPF